MRDHSKVYGNFNPNSTNNPPLPLSDVFCNINNEEIIHEGRQSFEPETPLELLEIDDQIDHNNYTSEFF